VLLPILTPNQYLVALLPSAVLEEVLKNSQSANEIIL
jgi:hypothetical protein